MRSRQFAAELEKLRVYRGTVSNQLLEFLEQSTLVVPCRRVCYPEAVCRRWWAEEHQNPRMHGAVELDGACLESARELENALHRRRNWPVYGPTVHPLDSPSAMFSQFVEQPCRVEFRPWKEFRTDVSNDEDGELYDDSGVTAYYATWKILLAAEVCSAGVHFFLNLLDERISGAELQKMLQGDFPEIPRLGQISFPHVQREMEQHKSSFDAACWYAEEIEIALGIISKRYPARSFLSAEDAEEIRKTRSSMAHQALTKFGLDVDNLLSASRFLAGRWTEWNRDGRPLVADAYKEFLAKMLVVIRLISSWSSEELIRQVGIVGGWHKPIIEVIWPNWQEEQKDRVRRTLKASFNKQGCSKITDADIDDFVEFLASNNLESFFWKVISFEDHALRGNSFRIGGMGSELQGMAVTIEHVMRALGSRKSDPLKQFQELWASDDEVLERLKKNGLGQSSQNGLGCGQDSEKAKKWQEFKAKFFQASETDESGRIAADLAMARFIRGAVHFTFPDSDQLELESLFVGLMRVAALTYAERKRVGALPEGRSK